MKVRELMTKNVASCKPEDDLSVAAKLMWDTDCGGVPVVGVDGKVKGMITDRDICMACFTRNQAPAAVLVRDAMSKNLYSCRPDSALAEAEKIMRINQVRRVPVVDAQGKLAGVLSLADIARAAERGGANGSDDLAAEEIVAILGGISQPQSAAR